MGRTSLQTRKKLQKLFNDKLTSSNLKVVFALSIRVTRFTFKDKLPKMLILGLVYLNVVAVIKTILVRPDITLKSEFGKIYAFHVSLEKRLIATPN